MLLGLIRTELLFRFFFFFLFQYESVYKLAIWAIDEKKYFYSWQCFWEACTHLYNDVPKNKITIKFLSMIMQVQDYLGEKEKE